MSHYPEERRLELDIKKLTASIIKVIDAVDGLLENEREDERKKFWEEIERITLAIEEIKKEVTSLVLLLIVRAQPLGVELLKMQSIVSVVYDTYRISRYCRELAKIDSLLAPQSGISKILSLKEQFKKARTAVEVAFADLEKYESEHEDLVLKIDNEVDRDFGNLLREVASSEVVTRDIAFKLLAMRHIERIVDHAVYIESHIREIRGA